MSSATNTPPTYTDAGFSVRITLTAFLIEKLLYTRTDNVYNFISISLVSGSPTTFTLSPFSVITPIGGTVVFDLVYTFTPLTGTNNFNAARQTLLGVPLGNISHAITTTLIPIASIDPISINMTRGTQARFTVTSSANNPVMAVINNSTFYALSNVINGFGTTISKLSNTVYRIAIDINAPPTISITQIARL